MWFFLCCDCYVWPTKSPPVLAGAGKCGRCGAKPDLCGSGEEQAPRVLQQWTAVHGKLPEPIGPTPWWELPAWSGVVRVP